VVKDQEFKTRKGSNLDPGEDYYSMPYVTVENKQTYYAGDYSQPGMPLIFCHGSGGGHHHWLYQLKSLSGKVNPIAVDLPGHGRSEGKPFNSVALYRDWLHSFSQAAGLDPFIPAGHSLGGAVALDYALHYSDHIYGLILVGTGSRLRVLPAFLDTLRDGTVPADFSAFLYGPAASEELLEKGREEVASCAADIYYADLSACDQFDVSSELQQIGKPVLIICGTEDRLTPVKYSYFLAEKLPWSRIEIIEGAGHMVMLEKPEAVNEAIVRFINELAVNR
jgi:pimeloyl-ACP methyl ester carboxylesterase